MATIKPVTLPIIVSTCTAEALVEITTPNNDLHEISASQFDELIATAGDTVVMVKFTSSKCVCVCICGNDGHLVHANTGVAHASLCCPSW